MLPCDLLTDHPLQILHGLDHYVFSMIRKWWTVTLSFTRLWLDCFTLYLFVKSLYQCVHAVIVVFCVHRKRSKVQETLPLFLQTIILHCHWERQIPSPMKVHIVSLLSLWLSSWYLLSVSDIYEVPPDTVAPAEHQESLVRLRTVRRSRTRDSGLHSSSSSPMGTLEGMAS